MPHRDTDALIVDDETDVCWALGHILKGCGFTSISANSGEQALAFAEARRLRLIFVDAKLPDFDGIELARRLREKNPGAPIVLISGYFYRDDIEVHRAIATKVISGFVSKPFLHDEVRAVISRTLA